jgi:hypothetical protein
MKEFYNKDGEGVNGFYIKNIGGCKSVTVFGFVMFLWITFFISTNYWVLYWL